MRILSKIRLVLAFMLLILGMITVHAKEDSKSLELKKKAIYYEIKAQLTANEITLEEAQALWQKKVKHLRKEEAK
tara:strand:+ start:1255 stop:1479 length:225 start_codon:yes stop_codon:yes gene_type:complete